VSQESFGRGIDRQPIKAATASYQSSKIARAAIRLGERRDRQTAQPACVAPLELYPFLRDYTRNHRQFCSRFITAVQGMLPCTGQDFRRQGSSANDSVNPSTDERKQNDQKDHMVF